MSEAERVVEGEKVGQPAGKPVTEEIKVQAHDLLQVIHNVIREGQVRRVTVIRKGRTLLDIPLVAGVAAGAVLAFYLPFLSAIAAAGALLGGCTVRIERTEPKVES